MMNRTVSIRPNLHRLALLGSSLLLAGALLLETTPARSQELDPGDLEDLIAPIALYPDDVLSIVMAASTFPLDIVRAARFLDELENDPTLQPDEAWDESIIALLNYPEILRMMNDDLDWTWELGEAVLTDEAAVLAAAQDFRSRALAAGNLPSDDKQIVTQSEGVIEITPADPEVVYVPVYEPHEVVVYHPQPIYRYYPVGYPVYYYPYPYGYFFPRDFFWGVTSYFSIGWHTHHLHVHHHSHYLHPYYLSSQYFNHPYFYRDNVILTVSLDQHTNVWRPSPRRGDRPRTVTREGRASAVRTRSSATVETQPNLSTTRSDASGGGAQNSRFTTRRAGSADGTAARGQTTTRSGTTTTRSGTTRRGQTAAREERPGTVIGGRVEQSGAAERSVPTRTRPVPSTSTSPSQIRGIRSGTAQGTTRQPTRVPTPAPRTSSGTRTRTVAPAPRTTPAPRTSTRTATRSQGASRSSTRSAPSRSAPSRSAPSRSARSASSSAPRTRQPR